MAENKEIKTVFDSIVKNALEFFNYSADEFDAQPKRALIDFITALELFIKSRLLLEHWTLLLNNLNKCKYANFVNGELPTIEFKEAIERLDKVLQEPLTKNERECFERLRSHRNKLVHFYSKMTEEGKENVLIEISEGWFYLHRLLKTKWEKNFEQYLSDIEIITAKIKKNKTFWQGKYNGLKEGIDLEIKKGIVFENCPICNYLAAKLEEYSDPIYRSECLICGQQKDTWIKVECNECEKIIFVDDYCTTCDCEETVFNQEILRKQLEISRSPEDALIENTEIYCTECICPGATVIELKNGLYFCLECFKYFDKTTECEWCNTRYAGNIGEDTYLFGCEYCGGHAEWHNDD